MAKLEREASPGRWWREPLLHFAALGALLFAVDYTLVAREGDPGTIVVDAAVVDEAKKAFRSSRNRDPDAEELDGLTQRWLDNEVLFRDGVALGVDQGDAVIRERVIFKMLALMEAGLRPPPASEATLRAWFDSKRATYDEPARLDFQQALLPDGDTEAGARALARSLNTDASTEGKASLRAFRGRSLADVSRDYGAEFASALERGPVGAWRALPSNDGWRVFRLDAVTPAKAAVFEDVRSAVLQDWTDATMAELRTQAVRERGKKYKLKREPAA